jgi:hypothetical protein
VHLVGLYTYRFQTFYKRKALINMHNIIYLTSIFKISEYYSFLTEGFSYM